MPKLKILITGGAGFIGSNIADEYVRLGHSVTIIDNLSAGSLNNLNRKYRFHNTDILGGDLDKIFKMGKFDVINHHAAQINPRVSISNPLTDAKTNILATLRLLQLSVKYGIGKFIFASSGGAVYGEQLFFPASETHSLNPISPYGISKLSIEKYLAFYKKYHKLNYVALRYSNVYGPRQSSGGESGVVSIFCRRIISGKTPVINGSGRNTRDFVYVKDVVSANVKALNFRGSDIFNISTGTETSISRLTNLIIKNLNSRTKAKHAPAVSGEQKRSVISFKKAEKILGWKPVYGIEDGLAETCGWFRANSGK